MAPPRLFIVHVSRQLEPPPGLRAASSTSRQRLPATANDATSCVTPGDINFTRFKVGDTSRIATWHVNGRRRRLLIGRRTVTRLVLLVK